MAESLARTGSYTPMFYVLASLVGVLALAASSAPTPRTIASTAASVCFPRA